MTPKKPPRLATFLLGRFTASDPLAGDLQEEFQSGRSAVWYWCQVLAAVLAAPLRRFDLHDLFAPQGMCMQVVMLGLVSVCAVFTVKVTAVWVFHGEVIQRLAEPSVIWEFVRLGLSFGVASIVGAAIARVHVRSRAAAVLSFSTTVPLWAFVNLYFLDGVGNLDSVLPHILALLVFISGLLTGGIHLTPWRDRLRIA